MGIGRHTYSDDRWIECRFPGCHRSRTATVHTSEWSCGNCNGAYPLKKHPWWWGVGSHDRENMGTIKHHAFVWPTTEPKGFEIAGVTFD